MGFVSVPFYGVDGLVTCHFLIAHLLVNQVEIWSILTSFGVHPNVNLGTSSNFMVLKLWNCVNLVRKKKNVVLCVLFSFTLLIQQKHLIFIANMSAFVWFM